MARPQWNHVKPSERAVYGGAKIRAANATLRSLPEGPMPGWVERLAQQRTLTNSNKTIAKRENCVYCIVYKEGHMIHQAALFPIELARTNERKYTTVQRTNSIGSTETRQTMGPKKEGARTNTSTGHEPSPCAQNGPNSGKAEYAGARTTEPTE
uniref:Uncharacterized protein n=1 Tax=Plectus sambesii TaxID=2011161 RepID=A0A914URD5_9BILA